MFLPERIIDAWAGTKGPCREGKERHMAKVLTSAEVAEELETDPKTLRKFLRSEDSPLDPVGQGNRYEIPAAKMRSLKKAFVTWSESHTRQHASAA
jgi:hypothetical protein